MQAEGRMLDLEWSAMNGHGAADCNFVPKQMTLEELRKGYNWLIRALYRYDTYGERLVTMLNRYKNENKEHKRAALDFKFTLLLLKVLRYYVFTFDSDRRNFFAKTFWGVLTGSPFSVGKWLEYFRWIATHRAFRKFVIEMHGIPEGVDPSVPPYVSIAPEYSPVFETAIFAKN